jgi:RimJ/RimL family protein N-acetyltransferase
VSGHPESARLRFRRATADDVAALHAHWNAPLVRRYLWDDQEVALETVRAVVAASAADFARAGFGLWVLSDAQGALVGMCGLRPVEGTAEVEILYSLEPARWGSGLATEAAAAVLTYAFDVLSLPRVLGGIDEPNVASRRVLERLGMRPTPPPSGAAPGVRYLVREANAAPATSVTQDSARAARGRPEGARGVGPRRALPDGARGRVPPR